MPIIPVGWNKSAAQTNCPDQLATNGPSIGVWIGFDPNYDPAVIGPPNIPQDIKQALIDSGASHNSIDADLAKALNLPIIDKKPVSGIHGSAQVEVCGAQLYLPHFNVKPPPPPDCIM